MEVHLPPLLLWVVCEVLGSVGSVSQLWSSQAVCGSMSKVFRYELWGHKTQEVMASGCHDDGARLAATLVSASSQLPRSPAPEHSPTQAPWRKDMRGQKILRTGCELCSMGKLLFNCRVPSLSTTLKRKQKKRVRAQPKPQAMTRWAVYVLNPVSEIFTMFMNYFFIWRQSLTMLDKPSLNSSDPPASALRLLTP